MRKPDFCICENKGADQLRGNREADQRFCFRYTDSAIPLLAKVQASSYLLWFDSPIYARPGLKPRRPVSHNEAQIVAGSIVSLCEWHSKNNYDKCLLMFTVTKNFNCVRTTLIMMQNY